MHVVLALDARLARLHGWALAAYALLFVAMAAGLYWSDASNSAAAAAIKAVVPPWLEEAARSVTYGFAALNLLLVVTLFLARRWMNPIGLEPHLDTEYTTLDPACVAPVTGDDLQLRRIASLGHEALSVWGPGPEERELIYRKYVRANPRVFELISAAEDPDAVGFSCVLPITEDACCKFRQGVLDADQFSHNDIVAEIALPANYLCLNAVYLLRVRSVRSDVRALKVVCHHVARLVRAADGSMIRPLVVAEGMTLEGRRFLLRYGFEPVGRSRRQLPIYQLDLSRPGLLSERARLFDDGITAEVARADRRAG